MRLSVVNIIFRKEIKEMLRDKRTIFVTFILPILLYPILIIGMSQLTIMMMEKIKKEDFRIFVENPDGSPLLMKSIKTDTQFVFSEIENPDSAIKVDKLDLIIRIPENIDESIAAGGFDSLTIEYSAAEERSKAASDHLDNIIDSLEQAIVNNRLSDAGLDTTITNPIFTIFKNVASKKKMGGFAFGGVLAFIVVIIMITGAYYPSVDLIAGEKERGTLETLLVSPAGRSEIVAGKFVAVISMAFTSAVLNLASMGLTFSVGISMMGGPLGENLSFSLTPGILLIILLILLPLGALFSAIFLAISSYAKSYKEAQSYLTPVFMAAQFPAMIALLPGYSLNTITAFVPVMNASLLFKDMLVGKAGAQDILIVFGATLVYAVLALKWAANTLSNEEHLLSIEEGKFFSRLLSRKQRNAVTNENKASAGDSIFLFAVVLALMWWVAQPIQISNIVIGLIITQITVILAPPLLLAKRMKFDLKKTFRLKTPNVASALSMIPAGIGLFIIMIQLQAIFSGTIELPPDFIKSFEYLFETLNAIGPVGGFIIIAVLPGICEELLFRGYILDGLTRKWGVTAGIVASGALFGLLHMHPYRLIPTAILGIYFGWIVFKRKSIAHGMIGHITHNGCVFILANIASLTSLRWIRGEGLAPWWIFAIAIVLFVSGTIGALKIQNAELEK